MGEPAAVTPEVRDRLVARFGAGALAWCDELPSLVGGLADRWRLDPVEAGGGGTSRVFRCLRRDTGAPVWLKLTPEPAVAREEAEALRAWAGTPSVVALLAYEPRAGALLLEDVAPGVPVRGASSRLPEVAALLRDLRAASPAPGELPAVRPLSHRIGFLFDLAGRRLAAAGTGHPVGPAVLGRSRAAALELAADGPVGLVHGDLHPANVLSGPGARLVAIDPRPAWGDPDFDAVDWVLGGATGPAVLEERIGELASLVPGQSPDRVRGWCRALAVLNALPAIRARRDDAETRFLLSLADG
ncbi:aminoglycoside phosphotransferase family protein [Streptomyces somaliensis]|uniref:aminoglycoside phosphotransferase family protein n=1 Tax=Streptomyces somaliensis TaxID=78355 RepID=UPI0020CBF9D9|nr:aminoglycoside phosphotransferase family protein [Streptomyces somaliensis]MCP9944259.1 aminoglycoside phosphotransferase family protein [Streptomyces somaliensis]